MTPRVSSPGAQLARLGFADPERSERLLREPVLAGLLDPMDEVFEDGLVEALSRAAEPDLALLGLVRVLEALRDIPSSPGEAEDVERREVVATLRRRGPARDRLVAVLGGSTALVDHLAHHPEHWRDVSEAEPPTAEGLRQALLEAVSPAGRGDRSPYDALRVAYRRRLLAVTALDLTSPDPVAALPTVAEWLAWLAEAALEAALAISREEYGDGHADCRLAVIGMGKTGGGELNYVSDVDVVFVVEPADGVGEERAVQVGAALAAGLVRACSAVTAEGTLWPVDAALRPEGKQGPLVRTVASHRAYYERWAKTWEFQALLKAYPSAGDREVARRYLDAIRPLVWEASARPNFVEDVRAMRRRVEEHVPKAEAERQLKLGRGGLRDVEFAVQLLQLVHGRTDPSLRSATTLEALSSLAKGGYVGRDDAATLDEAYRVLRTLEHRIQLHHLRRTHLMPTSETDLRRLGRSVGLRSDAAKGVVELRASRSREVRRLHERLFYRPLLAAAARMRTVDGTLTPEQARERLNALGFLDPAGALRHIEALTTGVSRRAAIQRALLPVMLGWLADEADPDAGLLAFRRVSEDLGTIPWYLKMLRDEGRAAERLARVLGRSRYVADLLARSPESVAILGDDRGLVPRTVEQLGLTMRSAAGRKSEPDAAVLAVRGIRRHELLRIAFAHLNGLLDVEQVGHALTDLAEATLQVSLEAVVRHVEDKVGGPLGTDLVVIGMGSLGGRGMGYASDADVVVVHRAHEGVADEDAQARALHVVQDLRRYLGEAGPDPALGVDADLRPEGKAGPLVRSLASYEAYFHRWAQTWELQALLRARPVAGDPDLARDVLAVIDPLRHRADGVSAAQVRDIRLMKARVEAERLPRGADRRTHLKLGLGGITDVEWTVQLLQLRHAGRVEGLRTTDTVEALEAARGAGLLTPAAADDLRAAWELATGLRRASVLWRGRPVESVPSDLRDADGVGRIVGRGAGEGTTLEDDYLRAARRCRTVMEQSFYAD
ncbi:bifunctional [glutamine synthetase] adenylyltransferase/[glutamine synthetase]-adenylyl-L-tyrosine phosphorylase [Lapillicoccus jejuensis]|uniref:Bifunctional glutamine synthetase adenylyltransferase/adenylyl-removing enzyme n=1 Tax=Lapillicoccus jejuensis TaxID=402171 RepID=A0A542E5W2_9MICO|nr:bifunctional [glutamine synthetase] adenylyltransferase/[glutamine synthetase]-adenylyl-L-tyrosine phosphorylase [Lapillicoccus jejuensis]TQJ10728.1 glutamate-ammonia-ligase adenylyltransferase [Lapillicoccus jejuensis]